MDGQITFRELNPVVDQADYQHDAAWYQEEYRRISCSMCYDVLPEYRSVGLDIHLRATSERRRPPLLTLEFRVCADVVRDDVLDVLRPHMEYFQFGKVFIGGKPLDGYVSVLGESSARVPVFGGPGSTESACPKCCRRFETPLPPRYIKLSSTLGKLVIANVAGANLRVDTSLFKQYTRQQQSEFRSREVLIKTVDDTRGRS